MPPTPTRPVGTGQPGDLPATRQRGTPSWQTDALDWDRELLDHLDWPFPQPPAAGLYNPDDGTPGGDST